MNFRTMIGLGSAAATAVAIAAAGCAHERSRLRGEPSASLYLERRVEIPRGVGPQQVITTAKAYLETRYRFGGNTDAGTDCSGFVQMIYGKLGITLPRSTERQAQVGGLVHTGERLRPGDLVFFETYRKGPSHVGIYLGEERFIHASTGEKKVVITSLRSPYYAERFLGAKRLFPATEGRRSPST